MRYKVLFSLRVGTELLQSVVSLEVHNKTIRKLRDVRFFQYGLAFSVTFLMQKVTVPHATSGYKKLH